MRLAIKQCRWCNRNPKDCDHAITIRQSVNEIKQPGVLVHNCPVYRTMLPNDTLVEIELKEIEVHSPENHYEAESIGTTWEWISKGYAQGYIIGVNRNRFYIIKLLEPVKLVLPIEKSIENSKEVEVTIRLKQLCDIKVISFPVKSDESVDEIW